MVSCDTSVQSLEKNSLLFPPNENNHFNCYGCATLQPQLGWQDAAEVAPAAGDGDGDEDEDEVEVWADLQGNYRVVRRGEIVLKTASTLYPQSCRLQLATSSLFLLPEMVSPVRFPLTLQIEKRVMETLKLL